jgi:hypothetical protein
MQNEYMTLDNPQLQASHGDHQLCAIQGATSVKKTIQLLLSRKVDREEQVIQGGQDLRISI